MLAMAMDAVDSASCPRNIKHLCAFGNNQSAVYLFLKNPVFVVEGRTGGGEEIAWIHMATIRKTLIFTAC